MKNLRNLSISSGIALLITAICMSLLAVTTKESSPTLYRILILLGGDVINGGYIQTFTYLAFFWSWFEIRQKMAFITRERRAFKLNLIPTSEKVVFMPVDVNNLKFKLQEFEKKEKYILSDLLKKACTKFHTSKSLSDLIDIAGIQITHSGGKTESHFTDGFLQSPSGVIVPVKEKNLEKPNEMSLSDIKNWKEWFLRAVARAVRANFDMVELHAAHSYGLNQWLSPITNRRNDQYGGSIQKNSLLLLEIVKEIRSLYPNLLLSVRMPGQDFIEEGLTISDCIFIAQLLEEADVDIINISSGIGGWKRPRTRLGEGYLVEEASIIQGQISIPVIGVGGIETGAYIDNLLNNQKVSLTAVGRAILKDPSAWSKNQLRGIHYA
jgi:NADPH2 dehydrogenase